MFHKKATRWVMAMTMMGMMGVIEAQTIDKRWVRQNASSPRDARQAIRYANNFTKTVKKTNRQLDRLGLENPVSFFKGMAPYKDAFLDAAEAVGAPHLDIVSNPDAPRTPKACWETAAWAMTGNHKSDFNQTIEQEIAKRGLPPIDRFSGYEGTLYVNNACYIN